MHFQVTLSQLQSSLDPLSSRLLMLDEQIDRISGTEMPALQATMLRAPPQQQALDLLTAQVRSAGREIVYRAGEDCLRLESSRLYGQVDLHHPAPPILAAQCCGQAPNKG